MIMETVLVKKYIVSTDPAKLRRMLAHLKARPLGLIPYKYRDAWLKRIAILEGELREVTANV